MLNEVDFDVIKQQGTLILQYRNKYILSVEADIVMVVSTWKEFYVKYFVVIKNKDAKENVFLKLFFSLRVQSWT